MTMSNDNILSTGFRLIDQKFTNDGVPVGTILGVLASPQAPSRAFMHNLIADRDALYYSTRDEAKVITQIHNRIAEEEVGGSRRGLGDGFLQAETMSAHAGIDDISTSLKQRAGKEPIEGGIPEGGVVIIDSIDQFESDTGEYREFLRTFDQMIKHHRALGVIRALSGEGLGHSGSSGRLITLDHCEAVLQVLHESSKDSVTDWVAIEKVDTPVGFKPDQGDDRLFEIHRANEFQLDLDPNRGLDASG